MQFVSELCKRFALSAAATMGVLAVLGLWSGGLEGAFMKKTEKLFFDKKDESKQEKAKA